MTAQLLVITPPSLQLCPHAPDLPHRQDPAVEQAFFIMPPLNGPGMDNQGVLMVSLGAATATEAAALEPQQVSARVSDGAHVSDHHPGVVNA
jgi:hypothetical protein